MAKPKKKHFASLAVLASTAVLVVVGSIMAYFSSADQVTNTFEGSRFDVFLTETEWDPVQAKNVVPGDDMPKNPQLTNKERTNGYVFIRVTVPCDLQMIDNDDGTPMGTIGGDIPMYKFMISDPNEEGKYISDSTFTPKQLVNTHWLLVSPDGKDYTEYNEEEKQYVYVYAFAEKDDQNRDKLTVLHEDQITEPLFERLQLWNFNEDFDQDKSHSVRVEGLGIQTDLPEYNEYDILGIWNLLKGEGGS